MPLRLPEKWRLSDTYKGRDTFVIPYPFVTSPSLTVVVTDTDEWECVSVNRTMKDRLPTWQEMMFVKNTFWGEDECVMQLYSLRSTPMLTPSPALQLWRPKRRGIPLPPDYEDGRRAEK